MATIAPIERVKAAGDLLRQAHTRIDAAAGEVPKATVRDALQLVGDAVYELDRTATTRNRGPIGFRPDPTLSQRGSALAVEALEQARDGLTLLDLEHAGVKPSTKSTGIGGDGAAAGAAKLVMLGGMPVGAVKASGAADTEPTGASGAELGARKVLIPIGRLPGSAGGELSDADLLALLQKAAGGTAAGEAPSLLSKARSAIDRSSKLLDAVLVAEEQVVDVAARSAARHTPAVA